MGYIVLIEYCVEGGILPALTYEYRLCTLAAALDRFNDCTNHYVEDEYVQVAVTGIVLIEKKR